MKSLSVLVVDDCPTFSKSIARVLKASDCSVHIASHLEEAKTLFTENFFDLVIVDCFIPGTDGFEISNTLEKLNQQASTKSIFFLMSGILKDETSRKEALTYPHIQAFMTKPISVKTLKANLKKFFPENKSDMFEVFTSPLSDNQKISSTVKKFGLKNDFELPFLFKHLLEIEFSGELKCNGSRGETIVSFIDGEVTGVFNQNFENSVGELLIDLGYLSRENLSKHIASDSFKKGLHKMGDALIKSNFISPHALPLALKEQKKRRLMTLFKNFKLLNVTVEEHVTSTYEPTTCLSATDLNNTLCEFICTIEETKFNSSLMKTFRDKKVSKTILKPSLAEAFSDQKTNNLLIKLNNAQELTSTEIRNFFVLLLSGSFEIVSKERPEAEGSSKKEVILEKLNVFSKNLHLKSPYEIFDLNPENISDQKVSKRYQAIAKELHPDKLSKVLEHKDLAEASRIFTEITKAFNSIKTVENRQTFESLKTNQEAQDKIDCSKLLETAKNALFIGQYSKALELLDTPKMLKNQPSDFGLYFLWAALKSKNYTLKQDSTAILKQESNNTKNKALYFFIKALLAGKDKDHIGFQKFVNLALDSDPHFLPARRELQIARSQQNKPEKKSWFSFKKSS